MKKIIAAALALILALGLCACGETLDWDSIYDGTASEEVYAKAIADLEKRAGKGDADAMLGLGYLYDLGYGVEEDLSKAFDWYTKSA